MTLIYESEFLVCKQIAVLVVKKLCVSSFLDVLKSLMYRYRGDFLFTHAPTLKKFIRREILHQYCTCRVLLSIFLLSSTSLLLAQGNCLRFVIQCSFFGFPTCGLAEFFIYHLLS